jgi:predicted secreted protein
MIMARHAMKQVSEIDDGREILLSVGAVLELSLPENAGTGFSWQLTDYAAGSLSLLKEFRSRSLGVPGEPLLHKWQFKVTIPGDSMLRLEYVRAWKSAPARSFTLKLRARPA